MIGSRDIRFMILWMFLTKCLRSVLLSIIIITWHLNITEESQTWLDKADLNVLCKELDEMVRLRIPDKYLAYYNWE